MRTPYPENNVVHGQWFPAKDNRRAVLVVPHWNAPAGAHNAIARGLQKFGIVLSSDEGRYFLGSLVEVGNIVCAKPEAKECKKDDIKGFMVRSGSGPWQARPGKPDKKKGEISEIVIPITPDENWQRVAVGKKGYMEYREYAGGLGRLQAIVGLLNRDEKPLMQDLSKAGNRVKVFAPACSYSPAEGE